MRRSSRLIALALCGALLTSAAPAFGLSRIQAVSFLNADQGYIGGWFPPQKGFVSYTDDGGESWTATHTANYPISSLSATSSGAWGALGMYSSKPMAIGSFEQSWVLARASVVSRAIVSKVLRLQSGRIVAVGQAEDYFFEGDNYGRVAIIATSDDSGDTWSLRVAGPRYPANSFSDPPRTWASIADIGVSPDGSTLYAVGNEWNTSASSPTTLKTRLIYKSTDNATTWIRQTTPAGTLPVNCVTVPSTSTVYAFGDSNTYLKTTNGGSAWSALTMPKLAVIGDASIADAIASSGNTVIVAANRFRVGKVSTIARTNDGGVTWTSLPSAFDVELHGMEMLTATHWVAVGQDETILHSRDAGVTWGYPQGERSPSVVRLTPASGFSYTSGPVTISGTAHDGVGVSAGVGVQRVEVRLRRADGRSWNGVSWTDAESWLATGSNDGWKSWSLDWQADPTLLAAPSIVEVTARATDGVGLSRLSTPVRSGADVSAAISLEGGAPFASSTSVSVDIAAPGATHLRWRVDGGASSVWEPMAPNVSVQLGAGEGTRTVSFDFAVNDTSIVVATASDDIVVDTSAPSVVISQPLVGASVVTTGQVVDIRATVTDAVSGVDVVEYSIRRTDGSFFERNGWVSSEYWAPARADSAPDTWMESWRPDVEFLESGQIATIAVRARDRASNSNSSSTAVSGPAERRPRLTMTSPRAGFHVASTAALRVRGTVTDDLSAVQSVHYSVRRADGRHWTGSAWGATAKWLAVPLASGESSWTTAWTPDATFVSSNMTVTVSVRARDTYRNERIASVVSAKRVKASLTRPTLSTYTLRRGRTYTATGYLAPKHAAGTYPVRIRAYRKVNGTYRYYGSFRAKATNASTTRSKYTGYVKLPYAGAWRLDAFHEDAPHLPTRSTFRYVTVR